MEKSAFKNTLILSLTIDFIFHLVVFIDLS